MAFSFLWYDLETFGLKPGVDRIASFACMRTNAQFEPVEEPEVLYGRLSPDYLPQPASVLVHGIAPQESLAKGLREAELAKRIFKRFSAPGTCIAGYNNIRFDDEFIRHLFYRNFLEVYRHAASRWDIFDVALACRDLRPEGIVWPKHEGGQPAAGLQAFCEANGLQHEHPHEALSDVLATVAAAKLIHGKQPKFFNFFFLQRQKAKLAKYINLDAPAPVLHTSRQFAGPFGFTAPVLPLLADLSSANRILAADLRFSLRLLVELPPDRLRSRLFASKKELPDESERIHIKGIHLNKAPILAPMNVLDEAAARRLGIDLSAVAMHAAYALEHLEQIRANLRQALRLPQDASSLALEPPKDVDLQLYAGGFFTDEDRRLFKMIAKTDASELKKLELPFQDARAPQLFKRYLCRNYPELLDEREKERWRVFCANALTFPVSSAALSFSAYYAQIGLLSQNSSLLPFERQRLDLLYRYGRRLERTLLKKEA